MKMVQHRRLPWSHGASFTNSPCEFRNGHATVVNSTTESDGLTWLDLAHYARVHDTVHVLYKPVSVQDKVS